jgi:hypothetical protein
MDTLPRKPQSRHPGCRSRRRNTTFAPNNIRTLIGKGPVGSHRWPAGLPKRVTACGQISFDDHSPPCMGAMLEAQTSSHTGLEHRHSAIGVRLKPEKFDRAADAPIAMAAGFHCGFRCSPRRANRSLFPCMVAARCSRTCVNRCLSSHTGRWYRLSLTAMPAPTFWLSL